MNSDRVSRSLNPQTTRPARALIRALTGGGSVDFCPCCDRMLSLDADTGYYYCPRCGWEEEEEYDDD